MSYHFKPGCDLRMMTPQTFLAWSVAAEVYEASGELCWATSIYRPGTWDQVMLHGVGDAIDLGLRDAAGHVFNDKLIDSIYQQLAHRLGKAYGGQYDVIDERAAPGGPHIHIEFQPTADWKKGNVT